MHLPGWAGLHATLDQLCEALQVRLTGLDTAFLCLDRDVSPMHLGALAIFRPVHLDDPGRLAALLADRAFPIAPLAAGQALVVGLSWYQDTAYIALHADREALADVQRLAEAMQTGVIALHHLVE